MLKDIFLDYDFDIFTTADYSVHEGSCIAHQVHELKDIHEEYGGFPDSYENKNTKIRQLWWDRDWIDFDYIGEQLNMEVITVSSILQPPGNVIPVHRDTFFQIRKLFPNDKRRKVRANIYLDNWTVGHFIQYQLDDTWHNSTHWKQGQGWMWDSDVLHLSANAGMYDKFTLQVSGFLNE